MDQLEQRDLAEQLTVAVRVQRRMNDLPAAFDEYLPLVAKHVAEIGAQFSGPPYARYHSMAADNVDMEIGVPVVSPPAGLAALDEAAAGEVSASVLPGGAAAVLVHEGPYDRLHESWARLDGLLGEAGLVPSGAPWESYTDSPDEVPPERLRTEIVTPLG